MLFRSSKIFVKLLSDGLSEEDAAEYFYGKFVNAWAGDNTPVIIDDATEN